MSSFNQNLKQFLQDHHHPELDQLHETLLQVYERRSRNLPASSAPSISEMILISAASAALFLSQQSYAMIIFGGYIGARVVADVLQQKNAIANTKHLEPLCCQSELFARRYAQHAHVDEVVRYLISMGLSQKSVERLICALSAFEPNSVQVEAPNPTYKIASPKHLRL